MAARLWNKAPFVRLLTALAGGVLLQWYVPLPLFALWLSAGCASLVVLLYSVVPIVFRYRLRTLNGVSLLLLIASFGALLVWKHDVRNHPDWFGHRYHQGDFVLVTIKEPLVEKANSFKALASVQAVYKNKWEQKTSGTVIVYFKKDSLPSLRYGSRLLLSSPLQLIKNAGNPGSFDYKTYNHFKGITHQVYVTSENYVVLPGIAKNSFQQFIFNSRAWVVETLRKFIEGDKEQGLAEALLIGYKDDLDKALVQSYSNTGVVHIIAISGLHLGLIYGLLWQLTRPLKRRKELRWVRLLLMVAGLWLFSLLAGAGPSVLRSALMFSLIAVGEVALRKTNIFNTLSFSAFVLLCINPFLLWDVGFQLSYAAVLSIVLFFQPIYNWFLLPNKAVDFVWKLTAVTLAAQVLTLPISIYHFHQAPLLFLVANLVAVPLGSLILMGLLLLCGLHFLPAVAGFVGNVLNGMIAFLNYYIEGLDRLPFATWPALSISVVQTILLLFFAWIFCFWLMEKERRWAWLAAASLAAFMALRGFSFFNAFRQQKLIVYNVPKHTALDVISGRTYVFVGDSSLLQDGFERNFHLQPSRVLHRVSPQLWDRQRKDFVLSGKQFLLLDEALPFAAAAPKQKIDVLILSKNPKLYIPKLAACFDLKQVVVDGSVPAWKAALWKKDCDSLKIPCYDVSERGAFVLNL